MIFLNIQKSVNQGVPIHTTTFDMAQLIEQLAADFELEAKKINMQIQVKPIQLL